MTGIFCISTIGVGAVVAVILFTVIPFTVIPFTVIPFDAHALTLQNDLFVKQHLPASVLYSGSTQKLGDTITAELIHPDGITTTVSDIFVTDQGLYASGFYLYKSYPVGEYTIKVIDDSENKLDNIHIAFQFYFVAGKISVRL